MDKTVLVERDIQEGKDLVEALDETEFKVDASLWFYSSDSDEWRLLIASPFVEENGPRKSYGFIRSVLTRPSPPSGISLKNVSVLSPNNQLIKLLKTTIHTGLDIAGIRFTRNVINNTLIEDAYIYRIL